MWYVIHTLTGREEELVDMIHKLVPRTAYERCFVIRYERIWRKQQKSVIHVDCLFPGYVFAVTEQPEELFRYLKRVPRMSMLLTDDTHTFLSIYQEEEELLRTLLTGSEDDVVRLSYVEKSPQGKIQRVVGPLHFYFDQIERFQFKKRYAIVRISLFGEERRIVLGILLKEDIQQELSAGNVQLPAVVAELRQISAENQKIKKPAPEDEAAGLEVGTEVTVCSGAFQGMKGILWKKHGSRIEVGIHLFGQDVSVELAADEVRELL